MPDRIRGDRHAFREHLSETPGAAALHPDRHGHESGWVHSFETAGTLDGPGIRFVLFLSGCQFRCLYCHNPDTWKMKSGWHVTVDEVMSQIDRYAGFLKKYGGGVTLSGGEPLVQDKFVAEVLRACKAEGLHTALDTNGSLGAHFTEEMRADTDLIILDLKSVDPETHFRTTHAEVGPVLDFARRMSDARQPMWLRFVLVPGLTDSEENVDVTARFAGSLNGVERLEILPFHQLGAFKWRELGLDYQLDDTPSPSPELVARVKGQFEAQGLTVF